MAGSNFRPIFKPAQTRQRPAQDRVAMFAKDLFTLPQLLMLGALCQLVVLAVIPARFALLPALAMLLHTVASTAMQATSPSRNSFLQGTVPGRTSAQLPAASYSPEAAGDAAAAFGSQPAREGIVVLHLGVRFNHPLGPLGPGGKELAELSAACDARVMERAKESFGCLGATTWRGAERGAHNTLLSVYYFRSVEGLNAFAHDKIHMDAWNWYRDFAKKLGHGNVHIGIFHEAFYSAPGAYETIYGNMQPVMLSAASVPIRNENSGEEEWLSPIVSADTSALRTQLARMGKAAAEDKVDTTKYDY